MNMRPSDPDLDIEWLQRRVDIDEVDVPRPRVGVAKCIMPLFGGEVTYQSV